MKRLIPLIFALLAMTLVLPAHAWEVSQVYEALAAQHFPGFGVLDGFTDGDITALLLTTPEGETRLAFCTADSAALTSPCRSICSRLPMRTSLPTPQCSSWRITRARRISWAARRRRMAGWRRFPRPCPRHGAAGQGLPPLGVCSAALDGHAAGHRRHASGAAHRHPER